MRPTQTATSTVRELSQGSRGGLSNPREREQLDARDVFPRDLELPRGRNASVLGARQRRECAALGSDARTVGTSVSCRGDLRDGQDHPLDPNRGDLRHLRDSGLVETIPAIGNDRALVVLTERGRDVLERNRWSSVHREELKLRGGGESTTGVTVTTSATHLASRKAGRSFT